MSGVLVLCATPIGNLGDLSPRLMETLREADVVFAEDTRRSRVLLEAAGAKVPVRSFFSGNERERYQELVERLVAGETVALVTDAGVPAISDPGLSAVRAAHEAGARVTAVPGPSALTTAVSVSGLPSDRFVFEGFLPRKGSARSQRLDMLAHEERTMVLFVAPNRLLQDLQSLLESLGGERSLVVTRELTKLHEEIWYGTTAQAVAEWSARQIRGEFTLVVAGAPPSEPDLEGAVAEAKRLISGGMSVADASRRVADETGVARRALYEALHAGSD